MKKILITGSAGFIFSNFMRKVMKEKLSYQFISVDKILAKYNLYNYQNNQDHQFFMGDISDEHFMNNVFALTEPDYVIHGAAESFVDDSIKSAKPFNSSNVIGTQVMIDMSLKYNIEKFIYVSTDEVYGQLKNKNDFSWDEAFSPNPRNPYSASKLSGELIVKAANQTHNLNYNITRCCNNFGPSQPPRNLVPKIIYKLLNNLEIPIHGTGQQSREWIYVEDHCSAIMKVLEKGKINETYNIGSEIEMTNLEMVNYISQLMKKDPKISFIKDRAGHDFRYSVNCEKLKSLEWKPQYTFEQGMNKCVNWYIDNNWYFNQI